MILTHHLVTLESFGANYTSPYAPLVNGDLKDGFVKRELPDMAQRPETIENVNPTRIKKDEFVKAHLGEDSDDEE